LLKSILLIGLYFFAPYLLGSEKTLYEEVVFNKPEVASVTEVYLGDRMLSQQVGEWKECITPKKTLSKQNWGGAKFVFKANQPMCKLDLDSKYFTPTYHLAEGVSGIFPVRWKQKGNKSSLCACPPMASCGVCVKKLPEDAVKHGQTFIYSENSFQQTIEYSGRSDDILKFNYSEFSDGFARQAFTREFQIDLSEGNIAAYKGAIIEIINATNVQIKYKVIRNFSSDL